MDLLSFLCRAPDLADRAARDALAAPWSVRAAKKGQALARQGEPDAREYIVLNGRCVARISDAEGRGVCVGLFQGPCVVTPNLARTGEGESLVTLEVVSDALVAEMPSADLVTLMQQDAQIRGWANGVLRAELRRKSDREWCLAALSGAERLAWFRAQYPEYEAIFGHGLIASFLGMTPVTLSRLRAGRT